MLIFAQTKTSEFKTKTTSITLILFLIFKVKKKKIVNRKGIGKNQDQSKVHTEVLLSSTLVQIIGFFRPACLLASV